MLRIRESLIDKLPAATAEMKPRPFPGRYPTRVWIAFPKGEVYLGKPSTLLCQRIARLGPYTTNLEMVEFDRAAKFFGFVDGTVIGCIQYLALYHPGMPFEFSPAARMSWFGMPFRTLSVGKHRFYTTRPPGEDQGLMRFISERINPIAPKPVAERPKLTRPKPLRTDYALYLEWNVAYQKWRLENAAYFRFRDEEKRGLKDYKF